MSCIYDDSTCKYYEDGRCDFPIMGSGYPYDAPCFGFDYEDDEDAESERGNDMNTPRRIDLVIADQAYILDALRAYREVIDSGCCNDCGSMKDCEFVPKPGQLVRYNCPFYERKEIKNEGNNSAR